MGNREEYIKLMRKKGFNLFPIPANNKAADYRFKGSETIPNQIILDSENYGIIPDEESCIVDFDDKRFESKLLEYATKYMVISTPHGFHLPVTGISGKVTKELLFDNEDSPKQIIDVQSSKQYCVGSGSSTADGKYENIGTDIIFNVNNTNFRTLIDMICVKFDVTTRKADASHTQMLRKQFEEGKTPGHGTSNDYFFQAALICNTEKNSIEEAKNRIKTVYDQWAMTSAYSGRTWDNIEDKINDVYTNNLTCKHGGNRTKDIDVDKITQEIISTNKFYSDKDVGSIYQERNGFLKIVTNSLEYRIVRDYNTDTTPTREILRRIISYVDDLPEIDEEIIIFKNGYNNWIENKFYPESPTSIGIMGFEDYDYIINPVTPLFDRFITSTFDDVNGAMLAASCAVIPEHQIRITMCYGPAGTGKTTYRDIILKVLSGYGNEMELKYLMDDKYATAEFENKTYVSIGEAPETISEFNKLKRLTGEPNIKVRKMRTIGGVIPNYTKIIMDSNHLLKIPDKEAGPMFDRLHLLEFNHRFRETISENKNLAEEIYKTEGEHVLSKLLQVDRKTILYPSASVTKARWEEISIPEKSAFNKLFMYDENSPGMNPMAIKQKLETYLGNEIDMAVLSKILKSSGYTMYTGVYQGIKIRETRGTLDNVI